MFTNTTFTRRLTALAAVFVFSTACGNGSTDGAAADQSDYGTQVFDSSYVHEVSLAFAESDYEKIVEAYRSTGDKEWMSATVTIDGVTYENAGIRLKGNSSLRGLEREGAGEDPEPNRGETSDGGPGGLASEDTPEELPWLIRLDKFVDEQNHDGIYDLVIRSNNSETALNEAVAVELLELAGLATQQAVAVSFTVNGSDPTLRLAIEHPDDAWMETYFDADGALYKAESTGDYSYRGEDPDSYDEVFDQEAGEDNANLAPLLEFLQFINESDDVTFANELAEHLDVDAFATYLAAQELIDNFDDIDGPGNNSYLYYDPKSEMFTVVAWDHNLAFGALARVGGGDLGRGEGPVPGEFDQPEDAPASGEGPGGDLPAGDVPAGDLPEGELPEGGPLAGSGTGDADGGGTHPGGLAGDVPGGAGVALGNVLSERFHENDEFEELYQEKLEELSAELYESGAAAGVLSAWVEVLGSTELVDDATVQEEAAAIAVYFEG